MPKHSSKRERDAKEPFTQIKRWEYKSPAFCDLSGDQFKIYWALRCRYDGKNNGQIAYSAREAGECIGKSFATGSRALKRLELLGFIKVRKDYRYEQKRLAREYELTAIDIKPASRGDRLPTGTKDFMRWTDAMIAELNRPKNEASARKKRARKKTKHSCTGVEHSFTHENSSPKVVKLRAN